MACSTSEKKTCVSVVVQVGNWGGMGWTIDLPRTPLDAGCWWRMNTAGLGVDDPELTESTPA